MQQTTKKRRSSSSPQKRRTAGKAGRDAGVPRDAGLPPSEVPGSDSADALHEEEIARLMQGLADLNRLRIVNLLLQRDELCVCDIERVLAIPQTRVSRHLAILRNAGLVSARRAGRWMHYRLLPDHPLKSDIFSSLVQAFPHCAQLAGDLSTLENADALACTTQTESSCCPPLPAP